MFDCAQAAHGRTDGVFPEWAHMAAQKREPSKNYIGLLSDDAEERHSSDMPSAAARGVKDYVFGLMAAIFGRGGDAR